MGESFCLVRSFSQPAEISYRETNEVVPHRVLTESVSFGRFASEPLQWEKWSAFTQNRYLEEVERFTKPGSVAEKKAFFEALFKKRSAVKATKKKIKEVNVLKTSDEIVCEELLKDILVDSEVPLVVNNGMAINEVRHEKVAPSISVIYETTDDQSGKVKITTHVENFSSMAVPEEDALDEENSTSLSKERRSSSSGSKACSKSSKSEPYFAMGLDPSLKKTRKKPPLISKRSTTVLKNQETSCAPSGILKKNIVKVPQNGCISSTNAKGVAKADEKKISGLMSLNFASSVRQKTKTAPKSSTTQETTSSNARNIVLPNGNKPTEASKIRKRPLPPTAKEGSNAAKCSTSASVVRLPELPTTNNQLLKNKRKNTTKRSSVSCNNVQRQPSAGCKNLSTHSRTRAKSFTVSSPFNFRSDERAEKRKEFFKKVEEKNKKEDSVKEKLSCGFKANQKTHLTSEEHKNPQVSMVSLTSPKFCRNQTSGKENMKKSHKVVSVNTINTRNESMEKNKRCKIHPSSRSQTNKKTQENSSPNILQS